MGKSPKNLLTEKRKMGETMIDKDKPFNEMTASELDQITREVSKKTKGKIGRPMNSNQGIRLHGYVSGKDSIVFLKCLDYAWKSGWIEKKNGYHFVNWALERVMSTIIEEMSHNPRFSDLKDNHD